MLKGLQDTLRPLRHIAVNAKPTEIDSLFLRKRIGNNALFNIISKSYTLSSIIRVIQQLILFKFTICRPVACCCITKCTGKLF